MKAIFLPAFALLISALAAKSATTLSAIEDNFVSGSDPDLVQAGSSTQLLLKRATNVAGSRKIYLKFDVSTVTINPTDTATFSITMLGSSGADFTGTFALYGLKTGFSPGMGVLGTDWTESNITWNNAPANSTGSNQNVTSAATQIGSTQSYITADDSGTRYSFALNAPLSNFIQADNTITLIMTMRSQSTTTPILQFASSEHTTVTGPTLTIVPEPAAPLLAGLGLIVLLRRKR